MAHSKRQRGPPAFQSPTRLVWGQPVFYPAALVYCQPWYIGTFEFNHGRMYQWDKHIRTFNQQGVW